MIAGLHSLHGTAFRIGSMQLDEEQRSTGCVVIPFGFFMLVLNIIQQLWGTNTATNTAEA